MRFVALDVETANNSPASVCQVGLVVFEQGREVYASGTDIDPQDRFAAINIGIHGITPARCTGAPIFRDFCGHVLSILSGEFVACHSTFDREALAQAASRCSQPEVVCKWVDTCEISRAVWPDIGALGGYSLGNVARRLELPSFKSHDAVEDARAAGQILLRALAFTGLDLQRLRLLRGGDALPTVPRTGKALFSNKKIAKTAPSRSGPLSGQTIVFTGEMDIPRGEAVKLASDAGAVVSPSVTSKTTMLVVGVPDQTLMAAGQTKSAKQRKAEGMIVEGYALQVVTSSVFLAMVRI